MRVLQVLFLTLAYLHQLVRSKQNQKYLVDSFSSSQSIHKNNTIGFSTAQLLSFEQPHFRQKKIYFIYSLLNHLAQHNKQRHSKGKLGFFSMVINRRFQPETLNVKSAESPRFVSTLEGNSFVISVKNPPGGTDIQNRRG